MTIPFPVGATAGARMPSQVAAQLALDIFWSARWSDEIGNDAEIDLKKLGQLAQHARRVVEGTNGGIDAQTLKALRSKLFAEGLEWATQNAMATDLSALRAELAALHTYVKANLDAEVKGATTSGFDPDGNGGGETTATLEKPHAVEAYVSAVRASFE